MRARLARATAVGLPVAALGVALWDPARHGGPPLCPWHALTGVACPGCGLTRAAGALLNGRVHEALDLHPLVIVVAAQLVALWVVAVATTLRRWTPPVRVMPSLLAINALLLLGVWSARLVDGSLPTA
jgi:hypothetical protein